MSATSSQSSRFNHPKFNRSQIRQWLTLAGLAVLSITGVGILQSRHLSYLKQQLQEFPSPTRLEQALAIEEDQLLIAQYTPSFGFDNLVADAVFLRFLQYFGDTPVREVMGYDLSPAYFEVILDRDPYFLLAYYFLSSSTSFYASSPDRTLAIINQHISQLSPTVPRGSYYIWRLKGIDELLFLNDKSEAQLSFEVSAQWAEADGSPEALAVAQLSQETAKFLAENNTIASQIKTWQMVLENGFDPATQQLAIQRIQALGGQVIEEADGTYRIHLP